MKYQPAQRALARLGEGFVKSLLNTTRRVLCAAVLLGFVGGPWLQSAWAGCQSGRCSTPTVTLASPASGATFGTSQSIVITGRATGDFITTAIGDQVFYTIKRVEVYNDTTLLGNATLGTTGYNGSDTPYNDYSYTIAPLPAGTYTLKVKAIDSGNSVSTVTQTTVTVANANASPTVSITSPAAGVRVIFNTPLTLTATASDSDGSVTSVQYFDASTAISGLLTTPPYSLSWTPPTLNAHTLKAVATDNTGATTTSAPVSITVNDLPTSVLTVSNVVTSNPGSITLQASASDTVGGITGVAFYVNGSYLSGTSAASYVYNWTGVAPGTYSIVARSSDPYTSTDSAPYVFTVNVAPTVTLTAPANGAVNNTGVPATIALTASAADSDGSISKVEYLVNGGVVATATAAPFSSSWGGVGAGTYGVQARATDNAGAVTTSAASTLTVTTGNAAQYVSQSVPSMILAGQTAAVSVTMKNTGTSTWTSAASHRLGSQNAQDSTTWGMSRVGLPQAVAPGANATFSFNITAPSTAGTYNFQWKMLQDAVEWFGDLGANATIAVNTAPSVSITSPSSGATFSPGWSVPVVVAATDNGSIAKVEIYEGSTLVSTLTTAPYSVTLQETALGSHTLTAKAYDNQGVTTTTAPVTFSIAIAAPPTSSGTGIVGKLTGSLGVSSGGAAQYAVPIALPPGTAGVVPSIALKYDSSGGNGVAGVGWSISGLSQITRCPRDWVHEGVRSGVDLSANDRFCLDGQRLVLVSGTYGGANSEYRTEIDSFTRIIASGTLGSGPSYFTATLRDGTKLEYGNTSDSKLVLNGQTTPLAWSVSKVTDPRTNFYTVTYTTFGTTGQQLLSRIDYTGNSAAATAVYNSIRFVYDQTRADVETRYVLGVKISNTARLTNVQTYAGATLVKDYRLAYNTSTPTSRSRVASVTECADTGSTCLPATTFAWENTPNGFGGAVLNYPSTTSEFGALITGDYNGKDFWVDLNGDGRPDHCIVVQHLNLSDVYVNEDLLCSLTQPGGQSNIAVKIGNYGAESEYSFVDFNGDGFTDVCNGYCTRMSSTGPTGSIILSPGTYSKDQQTFFVDLNGDGLTDYCRTTNDNVAGNPWRLDCYLGNGSGFGTVMSMGALVAPTCGPTTCFWADVSGDGIPSFCRIESSAMRCRKWTPSGFATEVATAVGTNLGETTGGRAWVDVNGDGKADFCRVISDNPGQVNSTGHIACALSTGAGFDDTVVSGTIDIGFGATSVITRSWVDVNGDGKADFCRGIGIPAGGIAVATSTTECVLSTGSGFSGSLVVASGPGALRTTIVDANGDAKPDLCTGDVGSGAFCKTAGGVFPDLLLSVSDGLGATSSLAYRPISDGGVYTKGSGAVFPTAELQDTTWVVQRASASNGVGGAVDTTYAYEGARVHQQGRGFLGFAAVSSTGPTGTVSRSETNQDFPLTGTPKRTLASNGGVILSETAVTYAATASAPYQVYPTLTVTKTNDLNGQFINWVESSGCGATYAGSTFSGWNPPANCLATYYDGWGNPLQVDTVTKDANGNADGYSQTSVIAFQNDTSNWILGRPTSLAITSRVPGKVNSTRTTTSSYFAANPGLGLLQQNTAEPTDTGTLKLTSSYTYDNFGNVLAKAVSGPNITTRTEAAYTYDAQGRGPITVRNALNHLETRAYDWRYGVVTSLQGPNLLTTSWTYDAFARPLTEDRADGTRTTTTYSPCASCVPGSVYSIGTTNTVIANGAVVSPPARAYYDTLGRSILSAQTGFAGQDVYAETLYDSLGRVGYKSANYFASDSVIRWTQFDYDVLGRAVKTTAPDNSISTATYNGRTTSATNNNGVTNSRTVNSQGKVVSVTDAVGTADASSVLYEYDNWGNLSKTTDAAGNVTTIGYDLLGRKTQLIDPDMGTWTYVVDNLGQVTSQTDAKSQTTTNTYDVLGRMTRRLESDLDSRWYYEANAAGTACTKGIGKLCEATSTNGYFRRNGYDSLGRLNSQTTHVDADYTATWGFDGAGRLSTQTYPSTTAAFSTPLSVTYNYNANGILQSVAGPSATFWTRNTENADGNVLSETYGNGLIGTRGYDPVMGRLTSQQAGPSGSPSSVQNQTYHYDSLGRLDLRGDTVAGTSETFGYDSLNRLTTSNLTAPSLGTQTTSTSFNAIGNITSKTGVGTYSYPAAGAGKPHAVGGVSGTVNGVTNPSFGYDLNGNMLTDGARTFTWTSFNMPNTLTKAAQAGSPGAGTSTFLYGPEHQRTKQTWVDSAKTLTTVYLSEPGFEKEINTQTGLTLYKHYVKVGSSVAAIVTRGGNGTTWTKIADEGAAFTVSGTQTVRYGSEPNWITMSVTGTGDCSNAFFGSDPWQGQLKQCQVASGAATEDVKYLIPDHLGSTSVVTGATGAVIDRQAFDPWGDRRVASGSTAGAADPTNLIQPTSTTRGYTGHEQLDQGNMGLTHMNGRVYDPTLGRFISADPNIQAPFNSQSFSRFSYVWNGPLNATDPTGYLTEVLDAMQMNALAQWMSGGGAGPQGFDAPADPQTLPPVTVKGGGVRCDLGCAADAAYVAAQRDAIAKRLVQYLTNNGAITWISNQKSSAARLAAALIAEYGEAAVGRAFVGLGLLIYSGPGDNGEDALVAANQAEGRAAKEKAKAAASLGANSEDADKDTTKRPSRVRTGTEQGNWDNAEDGANGSKLCPTCGKEVNSKPGEKGKDWDNDHVVPWRDRDLTGKDRKGVLDEYNRDTRLRCVGCNRSDNGK